MTTAACGPPPPATESPWSYATADLRPRWAVDSLERALPDARRVVLPGVGHIPWLEAPEDFVRSLAEFLR